MPTASAQVSSGTSLGAVTALGSASLILFLVAPRTAPGVLGFLALAIGLNGGLAAPAGRAPRQPVVAALLLLGLWALLSVIWAADRAEALNKSVLLAFLSFVAGWTLLALKQMRPEVTRHVATVVVITFASVLVYLFLEEASGHSIKRLMFIVLPFTQPLGKQIGDAEGDMNVAGYISNRNMAAVALLIWPVLLMTWTRLDRARRWPVTLSIAGFALASVAMSKHETSLIALALSAAVAGICRLWPKFGLGVVAAGWVVATMLVVPLTGWAAHGAKLHSAPWLPNSARHRVVIWAYTSEQVQHRPLLGVGAASTKLIDHRRGPNVEPLPGTQYQWRSGPHAHNVFLQVWYELGAIGAALLCAAGLALVTVLSRLPPAALPFGAATMTAAAVIGAFTWGLWQAWFLAAFAVAAVVMGLAVHAVRTTGEGQACAGTLARANSPV